MYVEAKISLPRRSLCSSVKIPWAVRLEFILEHRCVGGGDGAGGGGGGRGGGLEGGRGGGLGGGRGGGRGGLLLLHPSQTLFDVIW